jgi:hypothetical protein
MGTGIVFIRDLNYITSNIFIINEFYNAYFYYEKYEGIK